MNQSINDSLAIITAVLLLIFAAFAITYKKGRVVSHKILAAFLFANALYIIDYSLNAIENVLKVDLNWFKGLGTSFGFLFGPLLYLYSKSITGKDFTLKFSRLIHLIIFVVAFIIVVLNVKLPIKYRNDALFLQTIPYLITCYIIVINYRKEVKNFYSSVNKLNLAWMLYVVGAFFIMWLIDFVDYFLYNLKIIGLTGDSYMSFFSLMINFVFAILIFYKALQHPEMFTDITEEERNHKYQQSRLTEDEKEQYLHKLEDYFSYKKPFLNPELTISEVANELVIPSRYISQVINETLKKNFYDFINYYRIEEAKNMLKDETDTKKTILQIIYDSGFNSKSAFNTAFKKHTGFTPTQFRNREGGK